ncbi:hypothetical protein BX666DRAFT_1932713 [Dichotomocladium elegans]|nr:hypothetical protein BX666DRAFT_1932713 [Dichotomocladium elegans]
MAISHGLGLSTFRDDDGEHQAALIHFERESAAKTATLLSNALIDDSHIVATPYFADHASNEAEAASGAQENNEQQESKPKSRIAAEILANGYVLHDHIVAKGLEYDTKYGLSSRLQGYLSTLQNNVKQFDEKYRIWDKIVETDQKYKIHEKVQNATQTALQTPTAQKARDIANHTLAQIAAVHYEATKIKQEKATHAESDAAAPATTA